MKGGKAGRTVETLDEGHTLLWSELRLFRELEPDYERALMGDEPACTLEPACPALQNISADGTGGGAMLLGKFATKFASPKSVFGRGDSNLDRCNSTGKVDGTAFLSSA